MPAPEKKSIWVQIGDYSSLGVMLPACTFIGWLIGVGLDHLFGTTFLYLVFLIVGIAAGFVELIRIATRKYQ